MKTFDLYGVRSVKFSEANDPAIMMLAYYKDPSNNEFEYIV